MAGHSDICALDYLAGTIATAYRGPVTSLVVRDFCITQNNDSILFRGFLIALPKGTYHVSLLSSGREIARSMTSDGYFEVTADRALIQEAGHLQLDVIQEGRHIGTFLLKKDSAGGVYSSAIELSQDLKGINFRRLNSMLEGKAGLRQKAEAITAAVISSKKDWKRLSDEINSFARDILWADSETFSSWFMVLARFSARAASLVSEQYRNKAVANYIGLAEQVAEHLKDSAGSGYMLDIWFKEAMDCGVDLSARLRDVTALLLRIHRTMPGHDMSKVIFFLAGLLEARLAEIPVLDDYILDTVGRYAGSRHFQSLHLYSGEVRASILGVLRSLSKCTDTATAIERLGEIDPSIINPGAMARDVFMALRTAVPLMPADGAAMLMKKTVATVSTVPPGGDTGTVAVIAQMMRELALKGMTDHLTAIMGILPSMDENMKNGILFDAGLSASVTSTGDERLTASYVSLLKTVLIPSPRVRGFSDETWAEVADPWHAERIAGFMRVTGEATHPMRDVLVHLTATLYTREIFIPDERIFQREVTRYLNSADLDEDFLIHYLMLRRLPVYFNEIGASGELRELTTEIDSWGNDPLLYFLRKQVHVNASNYNVKIVEDIIRACALHDPDMLEGKVPGEIFSNIDRRLFDGYSASMSRLLEEMGAIGEDGMPDMKRLAAYPEDSMEELAWGLGPEDEAGSKALLLCRIYRTIIRKYTLRATSAGDERPHHEKMAEMVQALSRYRNIYTSPERTEPEESFYFKRHIAFGIPSVIGSYHEPKFDAFGQALAVEEEFRLVMENLVETVRRADNETGPDTIRTWLLALAPVRDLFALHDLGNPVVDEITTVMGNNRLHVSQINDLLRMWQRELTWMVENIYRIFLEPLTAILERSQREDLSPGLSRIKGEGGTFINMAADTVIRGLLNSIAGFEELDRLLNSLIKHLAELAENERDLTIGDGTVADLPHFVPIDGIPVLRARRHAPLLGSKAKNLIILHNAGLPVPSGVVLLAGHTFDYMEFTSGIMFAGLLRDAVKSMENRTGRVFGGSDRPLFVSVRSGSYISMPGILSSILYCGMNTDTVTALSRESGDMWQAWDSYRRFMEHYATVVHGIPEGTLYSVAGEVTARHGARNTRELDATGMEELCRLYLDLFHRHGRTIPEDPFEQLRECIAAVYRSWFSERAVEFRRAMSVSDAWGTAVLIMEMVHGNRAGSGASVFFTRKAFSAERVIYGETRRMATGDDLVYGRLASRPLSRQQAGEGAESLEDIDPELYRLHVETAEKIEKAMGGLPQEVEAAYIIDSTGERKLHVLQTKRMEIHKGKIQKFHDICRMESSIIGRGTGVHGGALSGIVTLSDSAVHIRELRKTAGQPVILLRMETSTDDVALMTEVDGIVTATGGATSHAAILAQKFDLSAVVGCTDMTISAGEGEHAHVAFGDYTIQEGGSISIDGSTGLVYSGICMLTEEKKMY